LHKSTFSNNIEVGTMRKVNNFVNISVYELSDRGFPKFYYDHSNHVDKIDEWLKKIQLSFDHNMYPLPPAIVIDSPKSGKSALLTRIMPKRIYEKFPSAIILYFDFLTVSVPINPLIDMLEPFLDIFIENLVEIFKNIGFETNCPKVSSNKTRLSTILKSFNDWLSLKNLLCFMLWDGIQRWFLVSSSAGSIFNNITLHEKFHNIAFAVTGSRMITVLQSITQFPTNGTSWIGEATQISVYPGVHSELGDSIASQANELFISSQMFQFLRFYHPLTTPINLLDYVTDSNPAVLAYFCQLHKSDNSNPGAMKKTIFNWYYKLWHDFENDSLPLLHRIQEDDPHILSLLLHVASETVDSSRIDLTSFGRWSDVFNNLLRHCLDGKIRFVGCYGFFIIRSFEVKNGTWKIKMKSLDFKVLIPSLWAIVVFLHEVISGKSEKDREIANKISNDIVIQHNPAFDFATDLRYSFFYHYFDPNNKYGSFNDPSDVMPYLTYLKYIRNAIAHIKSVEQMNDIHRNVPIYLSDWVKVLLEKFVL